jgi:putative toxin-antitoxin system antitoxin component (TIGR02293 family)
MLETAQIIQVLGTVSKKGSHQPANNLEWALALRAGLNYTAVTSLARHTGFAPQRIFAAVNLSPRTMERRRKQKKLSADESQKIARFARVVALGDAVFEDPQVTSRWLERENPALGGLAPLDLLDTEEGAREVESVLRRLEYGIYS